MLMTETIKYSYGPASLMVGKLATTTFTIGTSATTIMINIILSVTIIFQTLSGMYTHHENTCAQLIPLAQAP